MRAVIVSHEEHEGPGMLAPALTAAGFTLVSRFRTLKYEDASAELLVVLGGPMALYEADVHPFLAQEGAVVAQRLAADRPTLGICLGSQMLAQAAGAEVFAGKNGFEVGAGPVRWTAQAQKDPVVSGVRAKTTVAHWHGDTHGPVPGATLLASTDRYTQQAFRLGRSYGFQFHLELDADALGRWLDEGREALVGRVKDVAALEADLPRLRAAEPELRALIERLAHHFAAVARAR